MYVNDCQGLGVAEDSASPVLGDRVRDPLCWVTRKRRSLEVHGVWLGSWQEIAGRWWWAERQNTEHGDGSKYRASSWW